MTVSRFASTCVLFAGVVLFIALPEVTAQNATLTKGRFINLQNLHDAMQITNADYELCQESRAACILACNKTEIAVETCSNDCPICPVPVDPTTFVYNQSPTNTSSKVIRLTNVIHNVLPVPGFPGISIVDTEDRPNCCIVVRPNNKRIRLCGEHCKAPVMRAIPKISCNGDDMETCETRIKYIPYKERPAKRSSLTCFYTPQWPYIDCPDRQMNAPECSTQCLQLQYVFILRYGVPAACELCFSKFMYEPPPFDGDMNRQSSQMHGEWILEKSKCRTASGKITDNCKEEQLKDMEPDGSGDSYDPLRSRAAKHGNSETNPLNNNELLDMENNERFTRSKYSARNQNQT